MVTTATRYLFSVEEFERMVEAGVLREDSNVELIRGEIIQMAPVGNRHGMCVTTIDEILRPQVAGTAIIWLQTTVRLPPDSAPQPDLALLRAKPGSYWHGSPQPEDILVAMEISDTTLNYDLHTKVPLYAERGIPETWVWDLPGRRVHRFRRPEVGRYRESAILGPDEVLEAGALPGVRIPVGDTLPPEDE